MKTRKIIVTLIPDAERLKPDSMVAVRQCAVVTQERLVAQDKVEIWQLEVDDGPAAKDSNAAIMTLADESELLLWQNRPWRIGTRETQREASRLFEIMREVRAFNVRRAAKKAAQSV